MSYEFVVIFSKEIIAKKVTGIDIFRRAEPLLASEPLQLCRKEQVDIATIGANLLQELVHPSKFREWSVTYVAVHARISSVNFLR